MRLYREKVDSKPTELRKIADWAIDNGLYEEPPSSINERLTQRLSKAARSQTFIDPQGREVRQNYAVREEVLSDGEPKQITLWDQITTASPQHMQMSFQQMRRMMLMDNIRHKTWVDSYNENFNKGEQLEFSYDYTEDILEAGMPQDYPDLYEDSEDDPAE
jgi:hypothetical protein